MCCFLCPPRRAELVALGLLGQWQGCHNLIFLPPCWGWMQPWNGQVGSMKNLAQLWWRSQVHHGWHRISVFSAPRWHQTLSVSVTCLPGGAGGRESWSQAGGCWALEIWVISS